MFPLLYFILGIIFIQIIMPIAGSLTDWLLTYIEVQKLKLSVKVSDYNQEIAQREAPPAHQIGFCYNAPEEEDDFEND